MLFIKATARTREFSCQRWSTTGCNSITPTTTTFAPTILITSSGADAGLISDRTSQVCIDITKG